MNWPWQQHIHPARGTLTILDDGLTILGVPDIRQFTEREWDNITRRFHAWKPEDGRLIIPFPVDVDDQRTKR